MELTEAEIDVLEAGRELDILVAEQVMGLCLIQEGMPVAWDKTKRLVSIDGRQIINPGDVVHYSTTWGGAGMVFDKLAESHDFMHQWYEIGYWSWEIGELNEGVYTKIAEAMGETLPLAICRAALKTARVV